MIPRQKRRWLAATFFSAMLLGLTAEVQAATHYPAGSNCYDCHAVSKAKMVAGTHLIKKSQKTIDLGITGSSTPIRCLFCHEKNAVTAAYTTTRPMQGVLDHFDASSLSKHPADLQSTFTAGANLDCLDCHTGITLGVVSDGAGNARVHGRDVSASVTKTVNNTLLGNPTAMTDVELSTKVCGNVACHGDTVTHAFGVNIARVKHNAANTKITINDAAQAEAQVYCTKCHGKHASTDGVALLTLTNTTGANGQAATNKTVKLDECEVCHNEDENGAGYLNNYTLYGHGKAGILCSTCHDTAHDVNADHLFDAAPRLKATMAEDTTAGTSTFGTNFYSDCKKCHGGHAAHTPTPASGGFQGSSGYATVTGRSAGCRDCHDQHGTTVANATAQNDGMIRRTINTEDTRLPIDATPGNNWFISGQVYGACDNNLCHNAQTADLGTGANHLGGTLGATTCTTGAGCHTDHSSSPEGQFGGGGGCSGCHGYPPLAAGVGGTAGNYANAKTEDYTGGGAGHDVGGHLDPGVTEADGFTPCLSCHPDTSHMQGATVVRTNVQVTIGAAYEDLSSGTRAFVAGASPAAANCTNVSCHGGQTTPFWSGGTINLALTGAAQKTECLKCHRDRANAAEDEYNDIQSGKHYPAHLTNAALNCDDCHQDQPTGHFSQANLATTAMTNPDRIVPDAQGTPGTYTDATPAGFSAAGNSGTCASFAGCHGDANWDPTASGGCNFCHGYPPTSVNAKHASGVTAVNHDKLRAGGNVVAPLANNHDDCAYCHGVKDSGTGTLAAIPVSTLGGDTEYNVNAGGDHKDGKTTMNGNVTAGADAGYSYATGGCATAACHADNAAHRLASSATAAGVQLRDFGPGSCSACHDSGAGGAPVVTAASTHTDSDGAGPRAAGTCTDCHPGKTVGSTHSVYYVGTTAPSKGVVGIPNYERSAGVIGTFLKLTYGHSQYIAQINTMRNGIVLGGDYTMGTNGSTTQVSEAEICWACHASVGVSEWGVNNNANTGSMGFDYGAVTNVNWTLATWSSGIAGGLAAYKTGPINSVHTANPSWLGGQIGSNGPLTGRTTVTAGQIRCTYCHDVHGRTGAMAGSPYLRGSWRGNPYTEDMAPRLGQAFGTTGGQADFGNVPRGSNAKSGTAPLPTWGGYQIDQNNPNAQTAMGTAAQFGGLCELCHGNGDGVFDATEIDVLNVFGTTSDWVSTYNGHKNSVKGASGVTGAAAAERTARNIFNNRMGTTAYSNSPLPHYIGMSDPGDNGSYGFRGATSSALKYYPYVGNATGSPRKYRVDFWIGTAQAAITTTSSLYHDFSCSKCHNPHASRLPRLMITNCLDTKHNTWDNYTSYRLMAATGTNLNRSISNWTSAQNCHRVGGVDPDDTRADVAAPEKGWNNVTPW